MKPIIDALRFILILPLLALWFISVALIKVIYPEFLGAVLRAALDEYRSRG